MKEKDKKEKTVEKRKCTTYLGHQDKHKRINQEGPVIDQGVSRRERTERALDVGLGRWFWT